MSTSPGARRSSTSLALLIGFALLAGIAPARAHLDLIRNGLILPRLRERFNRLQQPTYLPREHDLERIDYEALGIARDDVAWVCTNPRTKETMLIAEDKNVNLQGNRNTRLEPVNHINAQQVSSNGRPTIMVQQSPFYLQNPAQPNYSQNQPQPTYYPQNDAAQNYIQSKPQPDYPQQNQPQSNHPPYQQGSIQPANPNPVWLNSNVQSVHTAENLVATTPRSDIVHPSSAQSTPTSIIVDNDDTTIEIISG